MDTHVMIELAILTVLVSLETTRSSTLPPNRRCYDCEDVFKDVWTPYTVCQANVTAAPVAICLDTEAYCQVEQVSVKGITIRLTRKCANKCTYGCRFWGFGVTELRCTNCCSSDLCNTKSGSRSRYDASAFCLILVLGVIVYRSATAFCSRMKYIKFS